MKAQPFATTVFPWLRANLGQHCLGALTSTDREALQAAVQVVALLGYNRAPDLVLAFGACVERMQDSTREFAFHAIAHVLDWPDRSRLWTAANLPDCHPQRCAHEPRNYHGQ